MCVRSATGNNLAPIGLVNCTLYGWGILHLMLIL